MKSTNLKLLALACLLAMGYSVTLSNILAEENEIEINEEIMIEMGESDSIAAVESTECPKAVVDKRSPKDRAMDILRDFLDLAKHPDKKWHAWLDEIHKELNGLSEYSQFCSTLIKLKGEKNALKVGEALKQYRHLLAEDLRCNIDNMLNNNKMKLFGILSYRIKK